MSPILLDTHVAIWSSSGMLTASGAKTIDDAAAQGELMLSPITAWEIGMLVEKRRIVLRVGVLDYVRELFGRAGVVTATLTPAIAATASTFSAGFHGDPADRILVATAAAYGATLVTADMQIHGFAKSTGLFRCIGARRRTHTARC